ncbi:MAG: zinc ribbon domain-containing protein [Ruminococcaceae bacterium]|nr:zinc ribbon domain-containing protein [Oscillospiraceae bacterium]
MNCTYCNAKIPPKSKFCNNCGKKVQLANTQVAAKTKRITGPKVLLICLSGIIATLFLAIAVILGLKFYENNDMSKVREFKGTFSDSEDYLLISQDGYGEFHKFEAYDENDELIVYREFKYTKDGKVKEWTYYDSEDRPFLKVEYKYNSDGTKKEALNYNFDSNGNEIPKSVHTTYYIEKGKEHELDDDIKQYTVIEYDKYGRMIKGENYNDGELISTWIDEYDKHGLVKETSWSEGDSEKSILTLKPLD